MSDKKILLCPFCEGEARLQRWSRTYGYYVICKKCGCRTPVYQYQYDSKEKRREDAINTWNTRVPMRKIVKRLEENIINNVDCYTGEPCNNPCVDCMNTTFYKAICIVKEEVTE